MQKGVFECYRVKTMKLNKNTICGFYAPLTLDSCPIYPFVFWSLKGLDVITFLVSSPL